MALSVVFILSYKHTKRQRQLWSFAAYHDAWEWVWDRFWSVTMYSNGTLPLRLTRGVVMPLQGNAVDDKLFTFSISSLVLDTEYLFVYIATPKRETHYPSHPWMTSGFFIVQPYFECLVLVFFSLKNEFFSERRDTCLWGDMRNKSRSIHRSKLHDKYTHWLRIDYQAIIRLTILCTVCLSTLVSNGAFTWT